MEHKELNMAQTAQVNQLVQPLNVICKSFTWVRTMKVFTCATRLHGTVQILFQPIAVLFRIVCLLKTQTCMIPSA